jgi:hypothetical protein
MSDFTKHGVKWRSGTTDLEVEMHCIKSAEKLCAKSGAKIHDWLFEHYKRMQQIIWPEEDHHRWSDLELGQFIENTVTVLSGVKDCISGDARILDPVTGALPTIQWLCESGVAPMVMTLDGPQRAGVPFLKGHAELFEVTCSNGSRFKATAGHLVMLASGQFSRVVSLYHGQLLSAYDPSLIQSIQDISHSVRVQDDQRLNQTAPDCLGGCFLDSRQCGGPLLSEVDNDQSSFPSQAYAPEHIRDDFCSDDLVSESASSLSCPPFLLSTSDFLIHGNRRSSHAGFPVFQPTLSHGCYSSPLDGQFQVGIPLHSAISRRSLGSARKHSFFSSPRNVALVTKVQQVKSVGVHPFYDLTVPGAHHYFAEGLIHHNSGKTHGMTKFGLCDYWCFPEETLIIISSTTIASLEGRVWGDLKSMFQKAKDRFPFLAGNVLDSKRAICTDEIDEEDPRARDMRKGLLCVACKTSSGTDTNISSYVGMKQKRRRLLADEMQFMSNAMFNSLANLNSGDFKLVAAGNPIGQNDPLDQLSEPVGGWDSLGEITKTTVWKNKLFLNSKTVALIGTDSPNFDPPYKPGDKPRYPYLIHQDSIDRVVAGYGKDSIQYWSQCVGMRRSGLGFIRVLTSEICDQGKAFEPAIWQGKPTTKVFAVDSAYGGTGGDRCIAGHVEFGEDVNGRIIIGCSPPQLVPVSVKNPLPPEDQIAIWCKTYCENRGIPASHCYHDATGRGSLGTAFARLWSNQVNPVEFGGSPTKRIVSLDMFILDLATGRRRNMRCDEQYVNFVSELWYSLRFAIESSQIRDLPRDCAEEGCLRLLMPLKNGNKIQVEPKDEMKKRIGRSPDKMDWLVTCLEGCRRLGFQISKMGGTSEGGCSDFDWLHDMRKERRELLKKGELVDV